MNYVQADRIAAALESIAASLQTAAAADPLSAFQAMLEQEYPAPATGTIVDRAPLPDDDAESVDFRLPDGIHTLRFAWEDDDAPPPGFTLWLIGPGGTVQPLGWDR